VQWESQVLRIADAKSCGCDALQRPHCNSKSLGSQGFLLGFARQHDYSKDADAAQKPMMRKTVVSNCARGGTMIQGRQQRDRRTGMTGTMKQWRLLT